MSFIYTLMSRQGKCKRAFGLKPKVIAYIMHKPNKN